MSSFISDDNASSSYDSIDTINDVVDGMLDVIEKKLHDDVKIIVTPAATDRKVSFSDQVEVYRPLSEDSTEIYRNG